MGLCPFPDHNEKSPSFSVSEIKQVYHCFGCKKSGNVFSFLAEIKGLSFPETVEFLAERASIPIPQEYYQKEQSHSNSVELKNTKKVMYKVNQLAARFYFQQLQSASNQSEVRQYLKGRLLSDAVIKKFGLGWSPNQWESLSSYLGSQKAPLNLAVQLGLIKSKSHNKYFDLFRNRLMFPIVSHRGDVVGFGGRVLQPEAQPKYLNSPESEVFSKGKTFYGLFETGKFIKSSNYVLVVEGYMDLLALYDAGIQNVVATLGTALTADHARLIKRYTKNVVVLFDGDLAGQQAAERSLPILLEQGLFPKGLTLPDQLDPDEYLKSHGAMALKEQIAQAPELFQLILQRHFEGYSGQATEKVEILDRIGPILDKTSDVRLKDLYVQSLSDRLMVNPNWVRKALTGALNEPVRPTSVSSGVNTSEEKSGEINKLDNYELGKTNKLERFLLNLVLMEEHLLKAIIEQQIVEQISHKALAALLIEIQQQYRQAPSKFDNLSASVISKISPPEVLGLQFEAPLQMADKDEKQKIFNDCVRRIKQSYLQRQSKEVSHRLHGKNTKDQLLELEQFMNIQKSKLSLRRPEGQ